MKKMGIKILAYTLPFIMASVFVLLVDPYNVFNMSHIFTDENKIKCLKRSDAVAPRGNMLWKTIEFKRHPTPDIVLGDSRVYNISEEAFDKRTGGDFTNLSVPGANMRTIIKMFWMADAYSDLKNVVIQINFNRYNAYFNYDLFKPVQQILDRPYMYFFNGNYVKDSFIVLLYSATGNEKIVDPSGKNPVDPWKVCEQVIKNEHEYIYPAGFYKEFHEISGHCRKEKINLVFLVFPDYHEVHNFIKELNYESEYQHFISDIRSLGTTIDLDNGIPFSMNRDNYFDYFHVRDQVADSIVSLMFN
jgi:hypothetical protein